jgi:hypothetical protein
MSVEFKKPDLDLAQRIVDLLNELTELDRPAVAALIANRVPCIRELAEHPTVQVGAQHGGFSVGLLGILNGLCGVNDRGWGVIAAKFEDATEKEFGALLGFEVNPDAGALAAAASQPGNVVVDRTHRGKPPQEW